MAAKATPPQVVEPSPRKEAHSAAATTAGMVAAFEATAIAHNEDARSMLEHVRGVDNPTFTPSHSFPEFCCV